VNHKQKSLVLITVDCLRADHCGFNGYARPVTPFLDALAAESFVVPTAVIAGAPTYYSLPAILASRMPLALGRDVVGLVPGENTLATVLHGSGYETAAFSAANPYISPHFGYNEGFEVFRDFLEFEALSAHSLSEGPSDRRGALGKFNRLVKSAARAVGLGRLYDDLYFQYCLRIAAPSVDSVDALRRFPSAEVLVDRAIAWLPSTHPFFLWLHLMDPHSPYYPSVAAFREVTGHYLSANHARYLNEFWNRSDLKATQLQGKKDAVVELYDGAIRSMDVQVGRLVAHLRQSALWENCVFVLTADHGEEFLDHGRTYHAPLSLHEEMVRVPLMIRVPGSTKIVLPETPFSHLHLAPTLLEIVGVPTPQSFRGTSLWRQLQAGTAWNEPAITESVYGCTNLFRVQDRLGSRLLSVRDGRHKMVMRFESGTIEEVYDLETDPEEHKPLSTGATKGIRKGLLRAAHEYLEKTSRDREVGVRLEATLRDLRSELQSTSRSQGSLVNS